MNKQQVLSQRELRKRKGSTVDATASNVQLQQQLTAATQNNQQQQSAVAISQQVGNALVVAANGSTSAQIESIRGGLGRNSDFRIF